MPLFQRGTDPYMLVVGMAGVKMGDAVAFVGCAHGGRLGAIAAKVGLSGRAVAIMPDEASAARARKGAADAGVLVDVELAPPSRLPIEDASINLLVIDDTGGMFAAMSGDERAAAVGEAMRVLRPGGRVMVIGPGARSGLAALLPASGGQAFDSTPVLQGGGFRSVRVLADREGLVFVEGIKPR